ncbi:putative dithiol-disulfide oxidoreductase (DUF899 family) [Asanoa ferruginea]|uniref:Putative dithiol-disulfide oxidoreductase (DUF899 family) n=1 Tax=Asanoa ferruginea TaxID=53367 RepID=A0A3D9ZTU1_9ACTN|nr:DUF899 family protein [Asanoa ferruginea]REG00586.1 putative dithiol-disulfide oxidoreductase (DUF899 family) [Asanoa ferruginea]GIF47750.1 hypothetical protein Afe04nite_22890 [Asanoa ferruginea]
MAHPEIVSREQWQAARDALLVKEKAATRALDALAADRRRLPMVRMRDDYAFAGRDGKASLRDLFEGRDQLVVYQFMDNGPDDICSGCASFTDNVGRLEHLHARGVSYAVVSNMPLEQLEQVRHRMEWTVPVYSSRGTTFSDDHGAGGGFGLSVFITDGVDVFQTYHTDARGVDRLRFDFNILDLTPYGRQENWEDSPLGWPQTEPYSWWRLHDEY